MGIDSPERLNALRMFLRRESLVLEAVHRELLQARKKAKQAEGELDEVQRRLDEVERRRREALRSGEPLSLAGSTLHYDYVKHQVVLEARRRQARDAARAEHEAASERTNERMLKVKALEEAVERAAGAVRRESDKRLFQRADDLWLVHRGGQR